MTDQADHTDCVDAWMRRAGASDLPAEQLVRAFEEAAGVLWQRAFVTLGEVTLAAMLDRVIFTAAEQFAFLAPVEVHTTGLRCDALRESAPSVPREQLLQGIRFVLVEMLTVIGNLTADILSPGLHAALSRVPAAASRAAPDPPAAPLDSAAREAGQS